VQVENWLDLVALGTVADLAPLLGENRALVTEGLKRIRTFGRQGLSSLGEVAGLKLERTSATDVGFVLGPRLNAAGRLESAQAAFNLLVADDPREAGLLAQKLDVQNAERQQITREIQARAETMAVIDRPDAMLIFAMDPQFNEGVVGLAASRLVEAYYRPVIVGRQGDEFTRASCRSIPEFNITEALDQCAELLIRHGGHKMAAGFTIKTENLPELEKRLQAIARNQLAGMDLRPTLRADLLLSLSKPDRQKPYKVYNEIQKLQPCGQSNPEPLFISRNLRVRDARAIGREKNHLRLKVEDNGLTLDAVAWRYGYWINQMPDIVDLIYSLELNEYMGESRIQLNVKDLKASGS
jgi:single-stranded-DNA-specific exonuclease